MTKFEVALSRPANFFELSLRRQWEIDEGLDLLDWDGKVTPEQQKQFNEKFGL